MSACNCLIKRFASLLLLQFWRKPRKPCCLIKWNSNLCDMTIVCNLNWKLKLQPSGTVAMVKMLPVLSLKLWMALCRSLRPPPPHLLSEFCGQCHRSCACKHENPIYSVVGTMGNLIFCLLLCTCLQQPTEHGQDRIPQLLQIRCSLAPCSATTQQQERRNCTFLLPTLTTNCQLP